MRNPTLKEYKKMIDELPYGLSIKSETKRIYSEIKYQLKKAKRPHANKELYKKDIDKLFNALHNAYKNNHIRKVY